MAVPFLCAARAEEVCRRSGAWGARRVVEKVVPLPDCTRTPKGYMKLISLLNYNTKITLLTQKPLY
jgi:hypothetical protein